LAAQIAYGMRDVRGRDRARYAGKTVAVLGAGHSAVGTLIELARLKDEMPATEIVWLLRGTAPEKAFGGCANAKLAARGENGAAPTFLMLTGYEQVRSIVAEIAGDKEAAARVELVLPETGVCNGPAIPGGVSAIGDVISASAVACCAGPPVAE